MHRTSRMLIGLSNFGRTLTTCDVVDDNHLSRFLRLRSSLSFTNKSKIQVEEPRTSLTSQFLSHGRPTYWRMIASLPPGSLFHSGSRLSLAPLDLKRPRSSWELSTSSSWGTAASSMGLHCMFHLQRPLACNPDRRGTLFFGRES